MDNSKDIVFGAFALVSLIVFLVTTYVNQRNFVALTEALRTAKSDPALIGQLHALAIDVVPQELLASALDTMQKLAALVKTVTPPDVDEAIDAGTDLASTVINPPPGAQVKTDSDGTITVTPDTGAEGVNG